MAKKDTAAKTVAPPVKSGEKKHGKKYRAVAANVDREKLHTIDEAIELLLQTSTTKFDSSVEIHTNLGIDPKHADQIIRGTIALPNGTGKDLRVIAFVDEGKVSDAKAAGATEAGAEDLVEKIAKGWMDFDVAVAAPDQMRHLGKIAKTLGQKGLMPNPKAGTVSPDPAAAISEIKKGRIEYKNDKQGNTHNLFGKVSFGAEKLKENLQLILKTIKDAKPSGVKGTYINNVSVCTAMGPGIKIDPSNI
ncbi:MAG: 50S ribosomal protein L1 [Candidatus Gracilibacteria bacterium]|nr:50S ribosomal protein L1 [Candidatus Gracilibacteria bacterium]